MNDDAERLRRWRLVLGGDEADGTNVSLDKRDAAIDQCLAALYEPQPASGRKRQGGLGGSAP